MSYFLISETGEVGCDLIKCARVTFPHQILLSTLDALKALRSCNAKPSICFLGPVASGRVITGFCKCGGTALLSVMPRPAQVLPHWSVVSKREGECDTCKHDSNGFLTFYSLSPHDESVVRLGFHHTWLSQSRGLLFCGRLFLTWALKTAIG